MNHVVLNQMARRIRVLRAGLAHERRERARLEAELELLRADFEKLARPAPRWLDVESTLDEARRLLAAMEPTPASVIAERRRVWEAA